MSELPLVLDLFSGTGSATQPFVECGAHRVIRFDIAVNRQVRPDVRADVRRLPVARGIPVQYSHESAPCTEFSPLTLVSVAKGQRGPRRPFEGVELARIAHEQVLELEPDFWTAENVRAAEPWLTPVYGRVLMRRNAWVLWGNAPIGLTRTSNRIFKFPATTPVLRKLTWSDHVGGKRRTNGNVYTIHNPEGMPKGAIRAAIPRQITEAVHRAVCPKVAPPENPSP